MHKAIKGHIRHRVREDFPALRSSDIRTSANKTAVHGSVNPPLPSPMYVWNDSSYVPLVLPLLFALLGWYWLRKRSKTALPYPPGPKPYPIIGNLLDFPHGVPLWEGLTDLAKQHGKRLPPPELLGLKLWF